MAFLDTLTAAKREIIRATAGAYLRAQAQKADNSERIARLVNVRAENDRPLEVPDFKELAAEDKIPPAHIHAIANAESYGHGFEEGRPVIMVEPHIFSRLTAGAFDGPRYGCSYPDWAPYRPELPPPPGFDRHPYLYKQSERWGLFVTMAELDTDAALGAISVGRFQQLLGSPKDSMGWKLLRYPSAEALFLKLAKSERDQLEIMLRFFKAHGALAALRAGNWRQIALIYNGAGQVAKYAAILEREFNRVARHYG